MIKAIDPAGKKRGEMLKAFPLFMKAFNPNQ
jgi:hypothetical protein